MLSLLRPLTCFALPVVLTSQVSTFGRIASKREQLETEEEESKGQAEEVLR